MKRRPETVEQAFPDPRGRRAGDAAVDAMPGTASMNDHLDAYEAAYFAVVGSSPFRPRKKP